MLCEQTNKGEGQNDARRQKIKMRQGTIILKQKESSCKKKAKKGRSGKQDACILHFFRKDTQAPSSLEQAPFNLFFLHSFIEREGEEDNLFFCLYINRLVEDVTLL
mmetsp:Transcript_23897/g.46940  ORF Transcript_23897/g.46940 Transcript_23897/m.46940 type:complete len:106 (-) Transcript_23897:302-619(-)